MPGTTTDTFRELALALPLVEEGEHMGHPDFRVGSTARAKGRIFASLPPARRGPGAAGKDPQHQLAMAKLTPAQQAELATKHAGVVTPAAGAWGAQGYTYIILDRASRALVKRALALAWENTAPVELLKELAAPRSKPTSKPAPKSKPASKTRRRAK